MITKKREGRHRFFNTPCNNRCYMFCPLESSNSLVTTRTWQKKDCLFLGTPTGFLSHESPCYVQLLWSLDAERKSRLHEKARCGCFGSQPQLRSHSPSTSLYETLDLIVKPFQDDSNSQLLCHFQLKPQTSWSRDIPFSLCCLNLLYTDSLSIRKWLF